MHIFSSLPYPAFTIATFLIHRGAAVITKSSPAPRSRNAVAPESGRERKWVALPPGAFPGCGGRNRLLPKSSGTSNRTLLGDTMLRTLLFAERMCRKKVPHRLVQETEAVETEKRPRSSFVRVLLSKEGVLVLSWMSRPAWNRLPASLASPLVPARYWYCQEPS